MPGEIITTQEALDLLDLLARLSRKYDSDSAWDECSFEWTESYVARCLSVIKDVVKESGVFIE